MLSDDEIVKINERYYNIAFRSFDADVSIARAIEAAATAPLLKRIAELEQANAEFSQRQEWWNENMFQLELELEAVRKDAERWRTFLGTRPENTHEVILQAIDDAKERT